MPPLLPNAYLQMQNLSTTQIKKKLKQLKIEKGVASKAVGVAKKNGENIGPLIKKVNHLSAKVRELESSLKFISQPKPNPDKKKPSGGWLLPSQFKPAELDILEDESLVITNRVTDQEWDRYVNKHPNASVYHSSAIKQVIVQTFGHSCHYLAAVNNENEIKGIVPLIEMNSRLFGHFLVSLPYFNYGGILASSTNAQLQLISAASDLASQKDADYIEYRNCNDVMPLPSVSKKVALLRNLPQTTEKLWSELGSKVRAQIRKGQRHGLICRNGREELVEDFYRVFSRNMRDLGTPVYSKSLFYNMLGNLPEAWISIIYHNQQPVSCGFLLGWRETVEIPWASTLREANRFDANMLLYWEILRQSIAKNYEIFDFGRSNQDSPTYRFKKQWGAEPKKLHWHYWLRENQELPDLNPNNPKFKLLVSAWRKLPLKISNAVGPYIVKSIP